MLVKMKKAKGNHRVTSMLVFPPRYPCKIDRVTCWSGRREGVAKKPSLTKALIGQRICSGRVYPYPYLLRVASNK